MTEQEILNKTIDYLNKHSICFKNWELDYEIIKDHVMIYCNFVNERHVTYIPIALADISLLKEDINMHGTHILKHINSEFRIAYNIIKDLAQHGTERKNNFAG